MSGALSSRETFARRAAAVERHLRRVAERLPSGPGELKPNTDASDAVILHLWQAVQLVIDLALSACLQLDLGTPENYCDALVRLRDSGHVDDNLARRLVRATAVRDQVVHAYEKLDMVLVHQAAELCPDDLRAFLAVLETLVEH